MREVERWRLSDATKKLLREALPDGYVSRNLDQELWLENLTLYREGDFMVGVFSSEGGGAIRVTESELEELRAAGFPDRESLKWVKF